MKILGQTTLVVFVTGVYVLCSNAAAQEEPNREENLRTVTASEATKQSVDGDALARSATLEQITNAWRDRQERIRTFSFVWLEKQVYAQGSVRLPPEPQFQGVVFPKEQTTCRIRRGCSMDGMMMRYEYSGDSLQF